MIKTERHLLHYDQAAKLMAKIGFLVLINMFKGRQMKIEGLLAAIAH